MSKKIAIVQSNYIPWKGYFDLIDAVDEFILLDDVQFTKRDWRNRNVIKTPRGLQWLTIPVLTKGRYDQPICECQITDPNWGTEHWKTLQANYSRAAHFKTYASIFENLYRCKDETFLSRINARFITQICELLQIQTRLRSALDFSGITGKKTQRLIALCQAAQATCYVSGPSAKNYIEPVLFEKAHIELRYFNYDGYPPYRQLYGPFEHQVSILDLLFNEGPHAGRFMKRRAPTSRR